MRHGAGSPHALIVAYLARQGCYVCEKCLAGALNLSVTATIQATLDLEKSPAFKVRFYWCSQCHRRDRVIRVERPEIPNGDQDPRPGASRLDALRFSPPPWGHYRAPVLPEQLLRLQRLRASESDLGRLG